MSSFLGDIRVLLRVGQCHKRIVQPKMVILTLCLYYGMQKIYFENFFIIHLMPIVTKKFSKSE